MIATESLKKNFEFMRAYKKGKFFAGRHIILYALANNLGIKRLGITAGKKVGGSVQRNRVKRLIRENYRLYELYIKNGNDIVFVARSGEKLPEFSDIKKEMKFLLKKLDLLDREKWESARG